MRKFLATTATAFLLAGAANAATIINLDGKTNASNNGSNAVTLNFAAGTYEVSFVQDQYTAFSRWTKNSECNSAGESCKNGFENSAVIAFGNEEIRFGHRDTAGGHGPFPPLYFATEAQSLLDVAGVTARFTLDSAQDVSFYIRDNPATDNRGGISLSVDAVPEPATWAMLITGFGMVGLGLRRRKETLANVAN